MKTLAVVLSAFLLASCANNDMGMKQAGGGLLGGALGGLAGSQIGGGKGKLVAIGAGTLLGALLGSEVGKSLDKADRMYVQQAETRAYSGPVGQQITWNNPNTGNYGSITPTRDGMASNGQYCREFQTNVTVGGQIQQGYGVACRDAGGQWRIVQ